MPERNEHEVKEFKLDNGIQYGVDIHNGIERLMYIIAPHGKEAEAEIIKKGIEEKINGKPNTNS